MTKKDQIIQGQFDKLGEILKMVQKTHKEQSQELFMNIYTIYGFSKKGLVTFFLRQIKNNPSVFTKLREKQLLAEQFETIGDFNKEFLENQNKILLNDYQTAK